MTTSLNSKTITYLQLAKTMDHSLLRPELTDEDVIAGIEIAKKCNVASVCVKPYHVPLAVEQLKGTDVAVGTVVGFPHGSHTTATKVFEAKEALDNGATELDMVINIGELRTGHTGFVREDVRAVVEAAEGKALVKVILENAYLSDEEKVVGCQMVEEAGGDFVKTSTGFASGGATIADLKLMRATVGPQVQVKAAGGVRSLDAILEVIDVGVMRVGVTATITILEDFKAQKGMA